MSLAKVLDFFGRRRRTQVELSAILRRRDQLAQHSEEEIQALVRSLRITRDVTDTFALTAIIAEQVLGQRMFDVQFLGALALQRGEIAEMQTGEGKTLAAVPAIIWYALQGKGVHVCTANDYLARRDSEWMGEIYRRFALSVAHLSQGMKREDRRLAYLCDITYATANEVGLDYLRDSLARSQEELVQRPFAFAVIDEADSILLDEARIPLVIAGGTAEHSALAYRVDAVVRTLRRSIDYLLDENARNVRLSDGGIRRVEAALGCANLFEQSNLNLLSAVQDALHAHALLRRDVDYVVKNGAVELVDEFKGRVAINRRWPAGLQSAIEAKERVALKPQGRILGSITVRTLVALYEKICGMTGTAATHADQFWKMYRLPVTVIPTNCPVIRQDLPDILYADREARDAALVEEISRVHQSGRPVLVGTASVQESERLGRRLEAAGIANAVLNARNDEAEAGVIAQAGVPNAVTISTNMAGRGTDILLGGNPPMDRERVVALGGLYVIGTTRHESRRIDQQLRGRAGRQGDPGSSRFFLSLEDDLFVRFGISQNPDIESLQRSVEGQNMEIRELLWKYESVLEHQRHEVSSLRRDILLSSAWSVATLLPGDLYDELQQSVGTAALETFGRSVVLATLDDLWADYLASVAELRGGVQWVSWGGRDPLFEFLNSVREVYEDFHLILKEEVLDTFRTANIRDGRMVQSSRLFDSGATWTYLTTDQPFGTLSQRILQNFRNKLTRRL